MNLGKAVHDIRIHGPCRGAVVSGAAISATATIVETDVESSNVVEKLKERLKPDQL